VVSSPDVNGTEPTPWARANADAYDEAAADALLAGAPHQRHASLRDRYERHARRLLAAVPKASPIVLELGAGDGATTMPFLAVGAEVVAVDVSQAQLDRLRRAADALGTSVETIEADADEAVRALRAEGRTFDVVSATSFLHHVPRYLDFLEEASQLVGPRGAFGSFQDPLRYEGRGRATRAYVRLAYAAWRLSQEDVLGGLRRRLRRSVSGFDEASEADALEYHAQRGGVDEDAVAALLREQGFEVDLERYFSTQSPLFQAVGERLGLESSFAVRAVRRA
jgi:SAM-dependent methyltransferase